MSKDGAPVSQAICEAITSTQDEADELAYQLEANRRDREALINPFAPPDVAL